MESFSSIRWRPGFALAGLIGLVLVGLGSLPAGAKANLPGYFVLLGLALVGVALCGTYVRTLDNGDCLTVSGGPLPLPRRSIRYEQIESAEPIAAPPVLLYLRWVPGLPAVLAPWPGPAVRLRVKRRLSLLRPRTLFLCAPDPEKMVGFLREAAVVRRVEYVYRQPRGPTLALWFCICAVFGFGVGMDQGAAALVVLGPFFLVYTVGVWMMGLKVVGVGDRLVIRDSGITRFVVSYRRIRKVSRGRLSWWAHESSRGTSFRGGGRRGVRIDLFSPVADRLYGRWSTSSIHLTLHDADGLEALLDAKMAESSADQPWTMRAKE
jgi:hypothetical protein